MDLITLRGEPLWRELCSSLEPWPPIISARDARRDTKNFVWVSCHSYYSPKGWWKGQIGTDHGPDDDAPVKWKPAIEDDIVDAWEVIEDMKTRGWLFHVLMMVDGWVVNGRRYELRNEEWDGDAVLTSGMVQEMGDYAPEAIYRAALAALSTQW